MSNTLESRWPEIDPRASDYYPGGLSRLSLAETLSDLRCLVDEWEYEQDPHGYCHVRPMYVEVVSALDRVRELAWGGLALGVGSAGPEVLDLANDILAVIDTEEPK